MEKKLTQHETNILKITAFGPESTGKTTLCKQLANHYKTVWVPEFARDYLQEKWNKTNKTCEPLDLLPIAEGQIIAENKAVFDANKILFCDTNLLLTKVFSETYYGFCDPILDQAAQNNQYDLFFLTDIDVPWQADDLRDKPSGRNQNFEYFKKTLIDHKKPFITLSGNEQQRLAIAIKAIADLIIARSIGFDSHDFVQIYDHKIDISKIKQQIEYFENGIPKLKLLRPAFVGNGIHKFTTTDVSNFIDIFEQSKNDLQLQKFVPASGAASRMFKFLSEFLNDYDFENESINAYINRKKANDLAIFLAGLEKFPFYETIKNELKLNKEFKKWNNNQFDFEFIKLLLSASAFDYANKAKGLLPFYNVKKNTITATELHLIETIKYAKSDQTAKLHLTVSPEHIDDFKKIVTTQTKELEQKINTKLNVSYSYQHSATDTIAVDFENKPFRDHQNKLVFRPGGHGALIANLNALEDDIVFIKNIDNVSLGKIDDIVDQKKFLAGFLITLQKQIFSYLAALKKPLSAIKMIEIEKFATEQCHFVFDNSYETKKTNFKINYLQKQFNRPIRVCGMVKNEGEPGGGPFWVINQKNQVSLQIVESSQIDISNIDQLQILQQSTHFNPVDLVCGFRDFMGKKFDLTKFVDHDSGFIVQKNKNGCDLQGFELPGLWNGAMANWITIFVELPLWTFNPVKTVNDLLKPSHQD